MCSGMAHIINGSHSFTCTPHAAFASKPKLVLIYRPQLRVSKPCQPEQWVGPELLLLLLIFYYKFKQVWVRDANVAGWETWLARMGKPENRCVLRRRLTEPMYGNSLMFRGIEFQTAGAANRKALRPMALAVKGMCRSCLLYTSPSPRD